MPGQFSKAARLTQIQLHVIQPARRARDIHPDFIARADFDIVYDVARPTAAFAFGFPSMASCDAIDEKGKSSGAPFFIEVTNVHVISGARGGEGFIERRTYAAGGSW